VTAPGPRRVRPVDPVRSGDGAVGVECGVLHQGWLVLRGVRPAAGVLLAGPADAGTDAARHQRAVPTGVRGAADHGAEPVGSRDQRCAEMAAAGLAVPATLRTREAGPGP